jgi:hypothetical protein
MNDTATDYDESSQRPVLYGNNTMVELPPLTQPIDDTATSPSYIVPTGPVQFSRSTKRIEQLRQAIQAVSILSMLGACFYIGYAIFLTINLTSYSFYVYYDFPNAIAGIVVGAMIICTGAIGIASSLKGRTRESIYRFLHWTIVGCIFCLSSLVVMMLYAGFVLYYESLILTIVAISISFIVLGILIACCAFRIYHMQIEEVELPKSQIVEPRFSPALVNVRVQEE